MEPAFGPCRDPGDLRSNPTLGYRAWSLLLPLPVSLPLCDYHKKNLKKEVKNRATLRFQNCKPRYLPREYKSSLVDSKRNTQPSVGGSVTNNSETVYRAQMSIDRRMGRDDVVNIHTATSLGHHKG